MSTSRFANLKKVFLLAKPEWKSLVLATFFLFIASAMNLAFPQAIRRIVDEALGKKDLHAINQTSWVLALLLLLMAVSMGLRAYIFATSGERIVNKLRKDLYQHLMNQEVAFFDAQKSGELTSRLAADTSVLQSAVSANISMGLRNSAVVVGCLALLFYTSWKLTLVMMALVPPVAFAAVIYGRRVRKLGKEVQDSLAKAGEVATETLAGIRTVRAFSAEDSEIRRYGNAVDASFQLARRRIFLSSTFMSSASFGAAIAAVGVLWYGGHLVVRDEMSPGTLLTFLLYTLMMGGALGVMAELWADLMKTVGAADRIFELLQRNPLMNASGGSTLPSVEGRVDFRNVHFAYPTRKDVPVLTGFSLNIAKGEKVALVGPSGAGKSTIAALLTRLYDPEKGSILLDGQDVRNLDPQWLRQQIGVVSQEPLLFSGSILDNILYGRPTATREEVERAARTANAYSFIQGFPEGFDTLVGERGIQLSGGQKQRVAIARAVLKNPRLLVLDEATSALDSESEQLVQEALERLMKGRTSLVIAHRLSTVIDADRVLVLDKGQLVQSGRHDSLVQEEGLYRRLVERQFAA